MKFKEYLRLMEYLGFVIGSLQIVVDHPTAFNVEGVKMALDKANAASVIAHELFKEVEHND